MNDVWSSLEERFDELSAREKGLIAACGFVTIVMLLFTMVLEPKLDSVNSSNRQLNTQKQSNQQTDQARSQHSAFIVSLFSCSQFTPR